MKCSRYKKLIHRMLDGDLSRQERREVCAHLESCEECRSYYQDLAALCASLREEDVEPPAEFEQRWKQKLAAVRPQPKKRFRPSVLVPVAAACAAVLFVSTILVNPQAFGLEGESMTGQWFAAVSPEVSPTQVPAVDAGGGQQVNFVAKTEKKPNVLDFENSGYSETTTSSATLSEISASGTIEPRSNEILDAFQEALEHDGTALPDDNPVLELSVSAEERARMRDMALEMNVEILTDDDSEMLLEGPAAQIEEIAAGHHLDIPDNADWVRLHID